MNLIALVLTLCAGLATVLGSLFVSKKRNSQVFSCSLAFATGLMLMIALGEMIPKSFEGIGVYFTVIFVILGALISLLLDIVLPHHHDEEGHDDREPGHYISECECAHSETVSKGMIIALLLHNVLEGLALGVTSFEDISLGFGMAIGIAIHNIPIGTTLGIAVISSGKKKINAILSSALVGLSQPLGALIGLLFFKNADLSICLSLVAGILIFISFDELWPAARKEGKRNLIILSLLIGICFIPLIPEL